MSLKEKAFLGFLTLAIIMMSLVSKAEDWFFSNSTSASAPSIPYVPPTTVQKVARQMSRWCFIAFLTPGEKGLEWLFRGMSPITPGENYQDTREDVEQWKRVAYLALAVLSIPVAIPATLIGLASYYAFTSFAEPIHYVAPKKTPSETGTKDGLSILSYNTALSHSFVCAATQVRPTHERVHEIASKLLKLRPDVVMLQECLMDKGPLSQRLSEAGYHVFRDVALNPVGSESGLITASTLPVAHAEFFPIGHYIGAQSFSNRAVFEVQLRLPSGKKVGVYNLHLQSGPDEDDIIGARSKQVDAILQLAQERLNQDPDLIAAFIGGDWNISEIGENGKPTLQWATRTLTHEGEFRNALYEARDQGVLYKRVIGGKEIPVLADETPGTFWNLNAGHGWGTKRGDAALQAQEGCNLDHFLVLSKEGHSVNLKKVEIRQDFGDSSDHIPLALTTDVR